jgi:predicted  nucleic acid-binding Zn-ribbon protein
MNDLQLCVIVLIASSTISTVLVTLLARSRNYWLKSSDDYQRAFEGTVDEKNRLMDNYRGLENRYNLLEKFRSNEFKDSVKSLEEKNNEIAQLERKVTMLSAMNNHVNEQMEKKEAELRNAEQIIEALEQKLSAAQKELFDAKVELDGLNTQLDEASKDDKALNEEIERLEALVAGTTVDNQKLLGELHEKDVRVQELEATNKSWSNENIRLQTRLAKLEETNNLFNKHTNTRIELFNKRVGEYEAALKELRESLDQKQGEVSHYYSTNQTLSGELRRLETSVEHWKAKYMGLRVSLNRLVQSHNEDVTVTWPSEKQDPPSPVKPVVGTPKQENWVRSYFTGQEPPQHYTKPYGSIKDSYKFEQSLGNDVETAIRLLKGIIEDWKASIAIRTEESDTDFDKAWCQGWDQALCLHLPRIQQVLNALIGEPSTRPSEEDLRAVAKICDQHGVDPLFIKPTSENPWAGTNFHVGPNPPQHNVVPQDIDIGGKCLECGGTVCRFVQFSEVDKGSYTTMRCQQCKKETNSFKPNKAWTGAHPIHTRKNNDADVG